MKKLTFVVAAALSASLFGAGVDVTVDPSAHTHDSNWYTGYGNGHVVDISAIFPNFDADVDSPSSYDFTYTDRYLGIIRASGTEVYYRLVEISFAEEYHAEIPRNALRETD